MYYIYIDEAGRGPLAWPVHVGIVIEKVAKKKSSQWRNEVWTLRKKKSRTSLWMSHSLTPDAQIYASFPARNPAVYAMCDDSKALRESQRNAIYFHLIQDSYFCGQVAKVSAKDIDKHWIVHSLRQGVMRAMHAQFIGWRYTVKWLLERADTHRQEVCLIIDWPHDFGLQSELDIDVIPVIDGDARIPMIWAASILTKVERDTYMKCIAKKHPQYHFEKHKWYGTKLHYGMIEKYGVCEEHRKSYLRSKT